MIDEHEVYVKRETADLLKKAGYNWMTPQGYLISSGLLTSGHFSNNSNYGVSAPTLEVAQRWLREIKNIEVTVEWCVVVKGVIHSYNERTYEYHIEGQKFAFGDRCGYKTYEEAKEAAITEVLNILINGQNS